MVLKLSRAQTDGLTVLLGCLQGSRHSYRVHHTKPWFMTTVVQLLFETFMEGN
jgi:hypothetical protein